jgi:predicted peptidase
LVCGAGLSSLADGFLDRRVIVGRHVYRYVVYLPPAWSAERTWPVILFLHGVGECGKDGHRQTKVGIGSALRATPERIPAIVVFPQIRKGECWLGEPAEAAMKALRSATQEFRGDPNRTYLTGLSLGGFGAWHIALAYPNTFAAMIPICGGIVPNGSATSVRQSPLTTTVPDPYEYTAGKLRDLPIWMFHGEKDDVTLPSEARAMYEALTAAGGNVRYTEYKSEEHMVWDCAYGEDSLWKWLFAQHLRADSNTANSR